jgi:hypothetical protein
MVFLLTPWVILCITWDSVTNFLAGRGEEDFQITIPTYYSATRVCRPMMGTLQTSRCYLRNLEVS